MGFCLFNNVAVTAAGLAAGGERVLIVDWDAHHGNGTQATFYGRADVCYVSLHQYPLYPGTGALAETGAGAGVGATVNVPLPGGTSGDAYREALDSVVAPVAERFAPDWVLISAGFDAHRSDPLTDLGLSAGDFADLTRQTMSLAPPGRRIVFLEGGYDLAALALSAGACVAALTGEGYRPEPRPAAAPRTRWQGTPWPPHGGSTRSCRCSAEPLASRPAAGTLGRRGPRPPEAGPPTGDTPRRALRGCRQAALHRRRHRPRRHRRPARRECR